MDAAAVPPTASTVHTAPDPETVTSPLSPSVTPPDADTVAQVLSPRRYVVESAVPVPKRTAGTRFCTSFVRPGPITRISPVDACTLTTRPMFWTSSVVPVGRM